MKLFKRLRLTPMSPCGALHGRSWSVLAWYLWLFRFTLEIEAVAFPARKKGGGKYVLMIQLVLWLKIRFLMPLRWLGN